LAWRGYSIKINIKIVRGGYVSVALSRWPYPPLLGDGRQHMPAYASICQHMLTTIATIGSNTTVMCNHYAC